MIKNTVSYYLPDARVLLFGSHARGNYNSHSDYDLLIITPNGLSEREKIIWSSKLDRALVNAIHAPFDILVYTEEDITKKRELPGHIVRTAMREGVVL